jgi:hypothetical protein
MAKSQIKYDRIQPIYHTDKSYTIFYTSSDLNLLVRKVAFLLSKFKLKMVS